MLGFLQELLKQRQPPTILAPYTRGQPWGWRRLLTPLLFLGTSLFCLVYGFAFALAAPYLLVQFTFPLILLAALTVWALPEIGRAPTRLIEVLFFTFFVAIVIWPNYLAIALPGLPWITMLRLTGFPLTFLLLLSVSISANFRGQIGNSLNAIPLLYKLLVAFVCVQFASLVFSNQIATSVNRLVALQISWTAIFFVSCFVFLRPGRAERWAFILWGMALFLGCIAIWESRLGHVPWAGHIPGFLRIEDESVQRMLSGGSRSGVGYRTQATYSTSLGLAEFMALTTPFLLYFLLGKFRPFVRIAAALSLPFVFLVIMLTDARLGVVGFFIACMLYLVFWGAMRWRYIKASLIGPAIVLAYPAIFTAFMTATIFVGRLRVMVWGGGQHAVSNDARSEQLAAGLPLIAKNPFGYGVGQGGETLGFRTPSGALTIDNYYLLIALDYGVLGFILYYGTILVAIGYGTKAALQQQTLQRELGLVTPLSIALTSFFIIKSIFSQTENHPIAFMMLGMICALTFRLNGRQSPKARVRLFQR